MSARARLFVTTLGVTLLCAGAASAQQPTRLYTNPGFYAAPLRGEAPRVHATAGFDLFLFHLLFDWGLTGSIDTAPRVAQGGVSFGIWN